MGSYSIFTKAFLGMVIFLAVFGALFGVAATNYNPWENAALARQADAETEYQQELNAVNIKVQQAQADAQVRKIELDGELQQAQIEDQILALEQQGSVRQLQYAQEINQQKALDQVEFEHQVVTFSQARSIQVRRAQILDGFMIGMAVVGCLVGVVLTGALGLRMVRSAGTGQAASPDEVVTTPPDSRWDDLVYREQAIQQARARENLTRGLGSKEQHRVAGIGANGNGVKRDDFSLVAFSDNNDS